MLTKVRYNRLNQDDKVEEEEDQENEELDESLEVRIQLAEVEIREIFDPVTQQVDLGRRRCTDICTNPRVYMPKARPAEEEAELLIRGRRIMEVAKAYRDRECDEKGNQKVTPLTSKQKEGIKTETEKLLGTRLC